MKFWLQFTGHINERIRPEGFPKQVVDGVMAEVDNAEQLANWVNARSNSYLSKQAMTVNLRPSDVRQMGHLQTDRIIVPMHMITHISYTFNQVIEQEVLADGLGGDLQTPEPEDKPKEKQN